jgi:hypothetical protein
MAGENSPLINAAQQAGPVASQCSGRKNPKLETADDVC